MVEVVNSSRRSKSEALKWKSVVFCYCLVKSKYFRNIRCENCRKWRVNLQSSFSSTIERSQPVHILFLAHFFSYSDFNVDSCSVCVRFDELLQRKLDVIVRARRRNADCPIHRRIPGNSMAWLQNKTKDFHFHSILLRDSRSRLSARTMSVQQK